MKNITLLLLLLFLSFPGFAQQQKRIYYNESWYVCPQEKAAFYRTATFDDAGNPVGPVKDYYITGELQWEGKMSYIDGREGSYDLCEGFCTAYYKNGNKER